MPLVWSVSKTEAFHLCAPSLSPQLKRRSLSHCLASTNAFLSHRTNSFCSIPGKVSPTLKLHLSHSFYWWRISVGFSRAVGFFPIDFSSEKGRRSDSSFMMEQVFQTLPPPEEATGFFPMRTFFPTLSSLVFLRAPSTSLELVFRPPSLLPMMLSVPFFPPGTNLFFLPCGVLCGSLFFSFRFPLRKTLYLTSSSGDLCLPVRDYPYACFLLGFSLQT